MSEIKNAADWVRNATSICVLTGAGMSAESGVATFRDAGGVWSKFNPAELATPQAFSRNTQKVWEWYRARRAQLREVLPHAGHKVLARWETPSRRVNVVTQNVDGLHIQAGSSSVIELHGRLRAVRCVACPFEIDSLDDLGEDPLCPRCHQRLRPGVVWFGEMLPSGAWDEAMRAIAVCDLALVIGTSGVVQPAASLADAVLDRGVRLIEINPNVSELSNRATIAIRAGCRDALLAIDAQVSLWDLPSIQSLT
ncbi:MAG: NAD-dependent deacylase [Phycisphaerales bacterium]|nr:NAD-dependent deacylase [Phycisphaerales bacterium]